MQLSMPLVIQESYWSAIYRQSWPMLASTPFASFLVTDNKTFLEKEESLLRVMGSCCVKQELTEEDIHFLKKHTRYDEETIREWYAGFLQVQYND